MKEDTVIALRQPGSFSDDPLTDVLRACVPVIILKGAHFASPVSAPSLRARPAGTDHAEPRGLPGLGLAPGAKPRRYSRFKRKDRQKPPRATPVRHPTVH